MASNRADFTAEDLTKNPIRVPTMIVIGTKDTLVGDPKLLRDSIPGSQLVMLEGRDHLSAPGDRRYREEALRFFKSAPA
jgi:pimeloyl-ACP methyl ester carboxylesterase